MFPHLFSKRMLRSFGRRCFATLKSLADPRQAVLLTIHQNLPVLFGSTGMDTISSFGVYHARMIHLPARWQ